MHKHVSTSPSPRRSRRTLSGRVLATAATGCLAFAPVLVSTGPAFAEEGVAEVPVSQSVVEAPVVEAPVVEAPVVEAPVVEAPAADPAAADTVAVESAVVEEVAAEPAPAAEVPGPVEPVTEEVVPEQAPAEVVDAAEAPDEEAAAVGPDAVEGDLAAAAVLPFAVTSPQDGDVTNEFANLVFFEGTGTTGNTITVSYLNAEGDVAVAGADDVDADGAFAFPTSFFDLAPGQTSVSVIVTQTDIEGTVVGAPVLRTFSFAVAPVEENPFAVTSPGQGETVTTTTPTFTGTGRAGDTVLITYTNASAETSIAGETIVAQDGTFSVVTSFVDLAPGAVEVRTLTSGFDAEGEPIETGRIATYFFFEVAPVPAFVPNPEAISVVPESITVSDSKNADKGLEFSATGFLLNEPLEITVTGPSGPIELESGDAIIVADETGSYASSLVLFGDVVVGPYTLTINGTQSGTSLSDSFVVVADPVILPPVVTPPVVVPAVVAPPVPIRNVDNLAYTGVESGGADSTIFLGVFLTLAGFGAVAYRRLRASKAMAAPHQAG